ncbi:MAG: hypothetical protein KAI66_17205 [Lentisphaeria bacterium]|nr:hypothetical protein [Lentisphaeria bacterium]
MPKQSDRNSKRQVGARPRKQAKLAMQARLCLLFAILGTLIFHSALFYMIGTKPPTYTETTEADQGGCILLSPEELGKIYRWERNLHMWYRLADPTVLVLPNDSLGFSSVRLRSRDLPDTPLPPHEFDVTLPAEQPFSTFALTNPFLPIDEEIRTRWNNAQAPLPLEKPLTSLPRGLFWRRLDGTLVQQAPTLDVAAVRTAIAEGETPKFPTRMHVTRGRQGHETRIRIQRASGNPQLDKLAITALRQAVAKRERAELYRETPAPCIYLPPPGQEITLEVEWSLLGREVDEL